MIPGNKITQLLVNMVAIDSRPVAVVESTDFKRLLNYLEPYCWLVVS